MSESGAGNPIVTALIVLLLVGGGWHFFRHYDIQGLDQVSVAAKPRETAGTEAEGEPPRQLASYRDPLLKGVPGISADGTGRNGGDLGGPATRGTKSAAGRFSNLKIASWALDGLGPTKLSREVVMANLIRVIQQFDIVAVQQVGVTERDIIPRLVNALNEDKPQFDFVIGSPTGPGDRPERMAFIFDTARVEVDRTQTYEVSDPLNALTYDPLVAWFRASEPPPDRAWTFTLVNVRIDLGRATEEVRRLPELLASIRRDGRGEDDVVLAGLFQADAATLLSTLSSSPIAAAVTGHPTDVRGRQQSSNLLVDRHRTTEFLGRGGVFDFLRAYNLDIADAEAVSGQLPIYGEFTVTEVGEF